MSLWAMGVDDSGCEVGAVRAPPQRDLPCVLFIPALGTGATARPTPSISPVAVNDAGTASADPRGPLERDTPKPRLARVVKLAWQDGLAELKGALAAFDRASLARASRDSAAPRVNATPDKKRHAPNLIHVPITSSVPAPQERNKKLPSSSRNQKGARKEVAE